MTCTKVRVRPWLAPFHAIIAAAESARAFGTHSVRNPIIAFLYQHPPPFTNRTARLAFGRANARPLLAQTAGAPAPVDARVTSLAWPTHRGGGLGAFPDRVLAGRTKGAHDYNGGGS